MTFIAVVAAFIGLCWLLIAVGLVVQHVTGRSPVGPGRPGRLRGMRRTGRAGSGMGVGGTGL
ncbi:hypothetical protein GCM10023340_26190 [Nocardioides marinquilinus]|uniref:Uncharacterized protein n=1 Tax=Nocardioides marinquilinus TaxID=1210400 RepID=A0ABP9PW17_9ACTN